jgi:crotonobetainyl-CoA:carnitine CoA-transferase CaiB-like acyl-CoA transferase
MSTIFEGVRVLSLAEQYPGPFATLLLADLGADVILVERPGGGDPSRAYPAVFRSLARNKRSICIDLKAETGKSQLRALCAEADVLIEGFRPGTMERLGVGYAALKTINPRLIYASISGFGQDGPYRDRTAHDLSYQAISGHLFDRLGARSNRPPAIAYGDLGSGLIAAFAVAAALFARERTGKGTAVDISMTDTLVSMMTAYLGPLMAGEPAFEILGEPAYGIFPVAQGRALTLSIAHEDHFWRALCEALGMQDVAALDQPARLADAEGLRGRIATALAAHPLDYWSPILDSRAIPWSPLNGLSDVLADPHFQHRKLFVSVATPNGRVERHVRQPVRFSAWPSAIARPAPALGEHTAEVLEADKRTNIRQN